MTEKKVFQEGEMSPPEIESWMRYTWEMKQKTADRIEDAAKALATMISIALSFFWGILGLNAELKQLIDSKILSVIWILALIISFFVLYPRKYKFNPYSADTIKKMTEEMIHFKKILFLISIILFIFGFPLFGLIIFLY